MEDDINRIIDIEGLKTERKRAPSRKIAESVFDSTTLLALFKLARRDAFEKINSVVSAGKEAVLFRGTGPEGDVAVKIYMIETSDFRNMGGYIRGDPRFSTWRNKRQLVYMWAQKEFKNLSRVYEKINCPRPINVIKNALVMEFIGEDGMASPKLRESDEGDPKKQLAKVTGYIRAMYRERLVHADLSEYNILNHGGEPVLIDFSTGVLLDHPRSMEFLERDIHNVAAYFRRRGIEADAKDILAQVTADD